MIVKRLALVLFALPLSACASVDPGCVYAWVNASCGQYYLTYQYPQLVPGKYEDGSGYINGTGAPLGSSHWSIASGNGAFLANGAVMGVISNPAPGSYGGH